MKHGFSISAVLIMAGACGSALGQNALGDGRALDNSLSTESRYNNARPSLADEFRFRNAVVTGNAPNGLSFRGDVGYLAPGEFTGQLGSNDLFSFRRDSLGSGLAGMGIRGSEALQMQFAMTTGGRPPRNLMGSYSVPRSGGTGLSPTTLNEPLVSEQPLQRAPELIEPEGASLTSLRAPSTFEANRGYQPMLLAWETPEIGQDWYGVTASELRGVTRAELTLPEAPSSRVDNAIAPERFETSFTALMDQQRIQSQELPAPVIPEGDPRSPWEIRLDELRRELLPELGAPEAPEAPVADPALGEGGEPEDEGAVPPMPEQPVIPEFDPLTIGVLRSRGEPSKDFVAPDVAGVYAEHMRIGQEYFRAGRYFDAEERFAHALTIRPNDVTAQSARIHAQIGAGMYLSAALNLRTLILEWPAVVSARFDGSLMPSGDRLVEVVAALREGVAGAIKNNPTGGSLRRARASGLLLAYIGFQTDDAQMVREGIDAARAAIAQTDDSGGTENLTERRLLDLIEAVWVDKQAP